MYMCNTVIYARVSSQGDRQNTERQVLDLTRYATGNGYTIQKVYEEHISGATRNADRTVLNECLEYCFSNGMDSLLISELSRLGRNVDEVLANVRLCKERHLNIYFQKESLSLFQPDGKENPYLTIMIAVLGTCAQMERENIMFKLNSGRRKAIENGVKMGRKVGSTKPREAIEQEYKSVIRELKHGTSLRRTARLCGCSPTTVGKVKKVMGL